MQQKSSMPGWWIPLIRVCQNFKLSKCYCRWIKFSKWVDIQNKLNLTKIGGYKMRGCSQTGPPKFKLFHLLSRTHEIFKVSKYKGRIKFDKIWGYQNGVLLKQGSRNSNFLTTHVRHMKISELANIKRKNLTKFRDTKIGSPLKQECQNSNFLVTHTRLMKFSE